MEEDKMEVVYVGKDRRFKTVNDIWFLKGKENLKIFIDEGEYKDTIKLIGVKNIIVEGIGEVKLLIKNDIAAISIRNSNNVIVANLDIQNSTNSENYYANGIYIKSSRSVWVKNCIIHQCTYAGIRVQTSTEVKIGENLVVYNQQGIYVEHSDTSIYNSSIIGSGKCNLFLSDSPTTIDKNLISSGQTGIHRSGENGFEVISNQNLVFSNTINTNEPVQGVFEEELEFEDSASNDFRVKGQHFKGFGVPEKLLLRYADKNNPVEPLTASVAPGDNIADKNNPVELEPLTTIALEEEITGRNNAIEPGSLPTSIVPDDGIAGKNTRIEVEPPVVAADYSTIKTIFLLNFSLENLKANFESFLTGKTATWDIEDPVFTTSPQDIENADFVFILNALDISFEESIDRVIKRCKKYNALCYIFLPSKSFQVSLEMINIERLPEIRKFHEKWQQEYPGNVMLYNSLENLAEQVFQRIFREKYVIRLQELRLHNIGNFTDLQVEFDSKVSSLIGLNGTGKTTIVRAAVLALTGTKYISKEEQDELASKLLRIKDIDADGRIVQEKGSIRLTYSIDGVSYENLVEFIPGERGEIKIVAPADIPAMDGNLLKNLVIGFPQVRHIPNDLSGSNDRAQHNAPLMSSVNDVKAMIFNTDDKCLPSFVEWITTLDYNAKVAMVERKGNEDTEEKVREQEIINKVFEIISKVTGQQVKLKTLKQMDIGNLWITTPESPGGIHIAMASQGYKDLIGWVGYFMRRMDEAHPDSRDFTQEAAIAIIDGIDSWLHPQWQARILKVMQEVFPNTQFIVTVHSPVILEDLEQHQIVHIMPNENSRFEVQSGGG